MRVNTGNHILQKYPHVLWFFGPSGAGKSTICHALGAKLGSKYFLNFLDGDDLRAGLNSDLGFSQADRMTNLTRAAHVAKLFTEAGLLTLASFITPLEIHRQKIKEILGDRVSFIFIDTPIEVCQKRDPKGLYKKATNGEIKNFTGLTSEFEKPQLVDLILKVDSLENQVETVQQFLKTKGFNL